MASRHDRVTQGINLNDVDDQTHEEAIAACNLLIAPSISDSFGMVFLDAWRYQKPVVACRNTCCETYIEHDVDGLLVEFGVVEQIAAALLKMLSEPAAAQQMGEAGYEKWQASFQWPMVAARFDALVQQGRHAG